MDKYDDKSMGGERKGLPKMVTKSKKRGRWREYSQLSFLFYRVVIYFMYKFIFTFIILTPVSCKMTSLSMVAYYCILNT